MPYPMSDEECLEQSDLCMIQYITNSYIATCSKILIINTRCNYEKINHSTSKEMVTAGELEGQISLASFLH